MSEAAGGLIEAVKLIQDDGEYSNFEKTNNSNSIHQENNYQPISAKVEDNNVLLLDSEEVTLNDYPLEDNGGVAEPLLKDRVTAEPGSAKKNSIAARNEDPRIYHLAYYQCWFDVNTNVAITRLVEAMLP